MRSLNFFDAIYETLYLSKWVWIFWLFLLAISFAKLYFLSAGYLISVFTLGLSERENLDERLFDF
jgi:hypothetical protein